MILKLTMEHPCVLKYVKQSKYMFKNKIFLNWVLKVQRGLAVFESTTDQDI